MTVDVFVSVGRTYTDDQARFVAAVESHLKSSGLRPRTLGRNEWSSEAPLKAIDRIISECAGTVIIAFERYYFEKGCEGRCDGGGKDLSNVRMTTVWNQIEAAFAYSRRHPLLVLVDDGIRLDGLLEKGFDWWVYTRPGGAPHLDSDEFNGVLADWKKRVLDGHTEAPAKTALIEVDPADWTLGRLLKSLKLSHLWALALILVGALSGAFTLGSQFGPMLSRAQSTVEAPDDEDNRQALNLLAQKDPPYFGVNSWNVREPMETYLDGFETIANHPQVHRATRKLRALIETKANPDPAEHKKSFEADPEFRAQLSAFTSKVEIYALTGKWPE